MNRLTQQKYDLTCALMKLGFEIHSGNEHLLFAAVDAYADARESKEIAELKAESKYWNERWEAGNKLQDAAFNSEIENYHEVKRLNAEIKRLRDCIESEIECVHFNPIIVARLRSHLSPAPVTETLSEDHHE